MLIVADVHGAFEALARVASLGRPLLVLGDLLNFVDYRTHDGLLAEVTSREFVAELSERRNSGDSEGAAKLWAGYHEGREEELRERFTERIADSYRRAAEALGRSEAYVTYGNADRPDALRRSLPPSARFVDAEVVEVEGVAVGFAGGGARGIGVPGEITEEEMEAKLAALVGVEMLCTHVAPAVRPLSTDVIGGRLKQSAAVLRFIREHKPRWHYFGDIHQPQATTWRIGPTTSCNAGYFRATERPIEHRV